MSPAATVPVFATGATLSAAPAAMPAGTVAAALDGTDTAELAAVADVAVVVDTMSAAAIIKILEHLLLSS